MAATYDGLIAWIEDLKGADGLIIVEGKKDVRALNAFGITGVYELAKPLYAVCEEVAARARRAIILTDLDREGKKLYGALNSGLSRMGVQVDARFREFLLRETKLRQIEGLPAYLERLATSPQGA